MLKCFGDCAYLDLMDDSTAAAAGRRTYSHPQQRAAGVMRQQMPTGTGESAKRREEEDDDDKEGEEEDYEEDRAYDNEDANSEYEEDYVDDDQFDDSLEHAPGAGERTWEYSEGNAAHQGITLRRSQEIYPLSTSQVSGASFPRKSKVSRGSSNAAGTAAWYGAPASPVPPASLPAPFAELHASAEAAADRAAKAAAAKVAVIMASSTVSVRNLAQEAMSEPAFSSSTGATEVRSLQNPGRTPRRCKARKVLARRTESDLAQEGAETTVGAPSGRRYVSTSLRRVRLSHNEKTLRVVKYKEAMYLDLALDDVLEVDEIPSKESVILITKDTEIRIDFKGYPQALKDFRTILACARSASGAANPSTGNALGSGNSSILKGDQQIQAT